MRAVWIGTVKAGSLKERAVTQQEEDLTVNAKRGTIFDRNGLELAVSEDATTVFANPFLIKSPGRVAGQAGAAHGPSRGRAAPQALATAAAASSTCAARWTPGTATRSRS